MIFAGLCSARLSECSMYEVTFTLGPMNCSLEVCYGCHKFYPWKWG